MKTTSLIACSLLVLSSFSSLAQNTAGKQQGKSAATEKDGAPVVSVGTIETASTSREKVLAYPRLLPQSLKCEVTSYDFTFTSNGKTWGPVSVKGAVFNEDIKDIIKDTEPVNVKISINNIHVTCDGQEMTARPINLEYNH